jgi:2-desacetyl-2-hydroxyethyl bacteriochlorophyllide A dehydrogenase
MTLDQQTDRVTGSMTMKAIVQHEYGSPAVLELKDVDRPVVSDRDVLVRVRAASVSIGTWHLMRGQPYLMRMVTGLRKPKKSVPGMDISGIVEAAGKSVTQFHPGDEVFGWSDGGFAEYACAAESNFLTKPARLTFEQAAAVGDSAVTALRALRDKGEIKPGQKVLILGASGGVGTFAVQLAKAFGAEVTAVCSTRNAELVRSIGADHVIDYTQEDFAQSGTRYDVVIDVFGSRSLSDCRRVLTPKGTYVLVGGSTDRWFGMSRTLKVLLVSPFVSQRLRTVLALNNKPDRVVLKELVESGKVTPVIDRTYPLSETAEAIAHVGEGHAQGKTVVRV